jgi:hypothetical protein
MRGLLTLGALLLLVAGTAACNRGDDDDTTVSYEEETVGEEGWGIEAERGQAPQEDELAMEDEPSMPAEEPSFESETPRVQPQPPPQPVGLITTQFCAIETDRPTIAIRDSAGGATFTFTAAAQTDVNDLRTRIRELADKYNTEYNEAEASATAEGGARAEVEADVGAGEMGSMGMGGEAEMQGGMSGSTERPYTQLPASRATFRNAPRGARLVIRAADRGDVETLRTELRTEATPLEQGQCPAGLETGMTEMPGAGGEHQQQQPLGHEGHEQERLPEQREPQAREPQQPSSGGAIDY